MSEKRPAGNGGNFSFDTVKDFDEHIGLSIPNYDILFKTLLGISDYFLVPGRIVYDMGCSTGKLLEAIDFPGGQRVGFDRSDNLLPVKFGERTSIARSPGGVLYEKVDLNERTPDLDAACLIFSVFTLQFLERWARRRILRKAADALCPGGALIVAEKTYAESSRAQEIMTFTYYDYKREGFSSEEILRKEISLRRMLRPLQSSALEGELESATRTKPQLFWKFLNFEAWICIKD